MADKPSKPQVKGDGSASGHVTGDTGRSLPPTNIKTPMPTVKPPKKSK